MVAYIGCMLTGAKSYQDKRIAQVITPKVIDIVPSPTTKKTSISSPHTGVVREGSSKQQVVGLIQKHFGRVTRTATAIAKAESNLNPNAMLVSAVECSVGVYQINLADNYCNGKWIHANSVPGDTIEAKIEWLKEPDNNIALAKRIYNEQGFHPWSTFTSGSYRRYR